MAPNIVNAAYYGNKGYRVAIVAILLIVMQVLMVTGRLVSRRLQKAMLGIDDYVLLPASAFSIGLCALGVAFPQAAAINQASLIASSNSLALGQASLAFQVLYALSVLLSKSALLLLYLRVFTAQMRKLSFTLALVAFIVFTTGVAYAFIAIFQCSPARFAWDKTVPEGGQCIDLATVARWISVLNVVDGLVMLVMPVPVVWRLAVEVQQKIALTATFFHGIFGFIASIVRLAYLTHRFPLSNNESVIYTLFTLLEPSNYIIAACLPTLRPILIRILPEAVFVLSRKRHSSSNAHSPSLRCQDEKGKKGWGSRTIKWSWGRGRLRPKISLVSRGASQLTGPWDGIWRERERGEEFTMPPTKRGEEKSVQQRVHVRNEFGALTAS